MDINKYAKQHKLKGLPSQAKLLIDSKGKINIKTKPVRTISGVAPVAIMTKYIPCPHGKCIMCPTAKGIPQSYTGKEPAARRAIRNKFNPYLQTMNRLEQYTLLGHSPEKVELIIMGGNFTSFPIAYQNNFVKGAFQAMNDFSKLSFTKFLKTFELTGDRDDKARLKRVEKNLLNLQKKTTLQKEQKKNETSQIRCVALAIESRPDYCTKKEINTMLSQGTTRIELGVQTIYNSILKKIHRGHTVEDSIKATQMLKDSFLKVGYHWMPGLLGSTQSLDLKAFKEIFSNQNFKPDALKIYPCMVLKNTKLYNLYKKNKFKPLTTKKAIDLIIKMKKYIPEYCRVMRVQRDIPTYMTEAGVDVTNLRQYIHNKMKKQNLKCKCIRCREPRNEKIDFSKVKLIRRDYKASNGKEIFLSYEAQNKILGFLRLRIPYKPFRPEITNNSAGIRELHVYGAPAMISNKSKFNQPNTKKNFHRNTKEKNLVQHRGIGRKLMKQAEKIAKQDFDIKKLLVISGIGVRQYYKKLGYKQDGIYVSKKI